MNDQSDSQLPNAEFDRDRLDMVLANTSSSIMELAPVRNEQGQIVDLEYVFVNNQLLRSARREELVGRRFLDEFNGPKARWLFEKYAGVIESGQDWVGEVHADDDGFDIWAQIFAKKLGDGCLVTYYDITDRKQADAEMIKLKDQVARQANDRYLTLLNSIDEGFYLMGVIRDAEGRATDLYYLEENPAAVRTIGRSAKGRRLREVFDGFFHDWVGIYDEVARTGKDLRREVYSEPIGKWLDFYIFKPEGVRDDTTVAVTFLDTTDRKRNEEALHRNETMFSTMVEAAPFGVYFIDANFRLISVNRGAQAVFSGIEPLIGRNFAEILREVWEEPFASEAIRQFRRTLETDEPYISPTTTENRAGLGMTESYDWQIHRITLATGEHGVVCYFYDLTKQKALEEQVRRTAGLDAFRAKLTGALMPVSTPSETRALASRLLCEHIGADRVVYFELLDGHYHVLEDHSTHLQSVVGSYRVESFGPKLLETYRSGRIAVCDDIETDKMISDEDRRGFSAIDVRAFIGVPLIKDGQFIAGLGIHSSRPRRWKQDEIELARETADRTWAAVERSRAEAIAREFDEQLRVAADAANLGTWQWNVESELMLWNELHFRLMGMEPRNGPVRSAEFFDRVHPDDRMQLAETLARSVRDDVIFDAVFRVVWNDGSTHWMSGYGRLGDPAVPGPRMMSGVMVEITERMKIEEELRESNERLRLLIESATDCSIFTTDRSGVINTWNTGSKRIYGYEESEVLGRNVEILFTPEDRMAGMHKREMEIAVSHGRALDERWHVRKDGSRFFASGLTQPLGVDGRRGFVKIARDMTERLRTEQARREKELLQTLVGAQEDERKRIARDLHDELGQQLTAMRLILDGMDGGRSEPFNEKLTEVKEIARSIDEGVDFLAWELRPAALDDLGLAAALEKFVSEWSHYSGVRAHLSTATPGDRRFDPEVETALYRIVQEALNNIYKHAEASNAEVTLMLRGEHLVLIVDDDGVGFDPDDPEIRRRGIGLIGINERVQILGGTLEIESGNGLGTTLYVKAPGRPV